MTQTKYEKTRQNILPEVEAFAHPDEPLREAATRWLVNDALMMFSGNQKLAAEKLRMSAREMNYLCSRLRLRPKDCRLRKGDIL